MRNVGLGLAAAIGVLLSSTAAHAKIFDLYAQAQGGGMMGKGTAGAQKANDFFGGAQGGAYGALVGAEVLFIDGWVEHDQFYDGSNLRTWTQFMVGIDTDFAIGDDGPNGEKPKTYGEVGVGLGYGLGTGQQVVPPLDAKQLSDKGFIAQASFGVDYRINNLVSFGLTVPVQYGYLFKTNVPANDLSGQYQSLHAEALLYVRVHLELKL